MNDNEAKIRVVADATGVKPGVEAAKQEMGELAPLLRQLNAQFAEMAGAMRDNMIQGAKQAEALQKEVRDLGQQATVTGERLDHMNAQVMSGAAAIEGMRSRLAGTIGLLVGYLAASGMSHFSQEMADSAEKTQLLSQKLGVTTGDVQRLSAMADVSQSSVDAFAGAMTKLDKAFAAAKGGSKDGIEAFKQIGIDVQGSYSQMDLLNAAMAKFGEMEDGPAKVALAMKLFGRSGAELIPVISMTAAQQEEFNEKLAKYGVINDAAVASGNELADAWDDNQLAMKGLSNTLTQAFAPMLTTVVNGFNMLVQQMVLSYRTGGTVRQLFDVLATTCEAVLRVIEALTPLARAFANTLEFTIPLVIGLTVALGVGYVASVVAATIATEGLGLAILAAFGGPVGLAIDAVIIGIGALIVTTGQAAKATAEYAQQQEILRAIQDKANEVTDKLATSTGKAREEALAAAKALRDNAQAHLEDARAALINAQAQAEYAKQNVAAALSKTDPRTNAGFAQAWAGAGGSMGAGIPLPNPGVVAATKEDAVAQANYRAAVQNVKGFQETFDRISKLINAPPPKVGTTGDISTAAPAATPAKSRASEWDAELDKQKLAIAEMAEREGTFREMSKSEEAAYWANILKRTDLSQEERLDIEKKYYGLRLDIRKDEFDAHMASLAKELDAARGNETERLRIANQMANDIKSKYGAESKEFQAAQDRIVQIAREAAEQRRQIEDEMRRANERFQLAAIDDEADAARFRVDMGLDTQMQLLAQERDFENRRYAVQLQSLERLKTLVDPLTDPVRYAQVKNQILQLEQQHQSRLTSIDRAATLQRTTIQRNSIASTAQLWGQQLGRLLTLQQGFTATVRGLWVGMATIAGNALAEVIEKWLIKKLTALIIGGAAEKAAGAAQISSNAAIAGSAAWASTAAIPIVGPALAPAAAATAYAGAMGFMGMLALPSAAKGWWEVPGDTMAMIHEKEMVLPAWAATPLRQMLSSPANLNAPEQANDDAPRGGDFHYHDHSRRGLTREEIMNNRGALAEALKKAHREGSFSGTGINF